MIKIFSILFLLVVSLHAEIPKVFHGLFEKEIPVKASIGMMVPPPEIEKYLTKVAAATRANQEWFEEYAKTAKPGEPLPFHENLGLSKEEYDDYLALWEKREFKERANVVLILRQSFGDTWSLTATGEAGVISTLRYDPAKDIFRSPNGELSRLEDIKADSASILGAWVGHEWRLESESGLTKTKENFAIGRFEKKEFGIVIYRVQEISSLGRLLLDKSLVLRFPLGKAGQIQPQAPKK
jgi:hypothetical protein